MINKLQRHCRFKDIMREVEIQRALIDCPYVCKLYEVWEWQSYVYLIEELCHGGSSLTSSSVRVDQELTTARANPRSSRSHV